MSGPLQLHIEGGALFSAASFIKSLYWILFGPRSAWFPVELPPTIPGEYEVRLAGDVTNDSFVRSFIGGQWNDPRVREWRGLAEKPL